MSLTTEQKHANMDEAYRDFMDDFTPYLHRRILELQQDHDLSFSGVLTVTGRGLTELGAMDLLCGLGGAAVLDEAKDFSNKILACVTLAARSVINRKGAELL